MANIDVYRAGPPKLMGFLGVRSHLVVAVTMLIASSTSAFQGGFQGRLSRVFLGQASSRGKTSSVYPRFSVVDDVELLASGAAETWAIETTRFFDLETAMQIEERLQGRADVAAFRVVGGGRSPASSLDLSSDEGSRCRFVVTHPDLGLDTTTADADYCTVLRLENVNLGASIPMPDALGSVGIDLNDVGDIIVVGSSSVYIVVDPSIAKQCLRLLPKVLDGAGVSGSVLTDEEFIPIDGVVQEMKLSRLYERQQKRKNLEKGVVQFG